MLRWLRLAGMEGRVAAVLDERRLLLEGADGRGLSLELDGIERACHQHVPLVPRWMLMLSAVGLWLGLRVLATNTGVWVAAASLGVVTLWIIGRRPVLRIDSRQGDRHLVLGPHDRLLRLKLLLDRLRDGDSLAEAREALELSGAAPWPASGGLVPTVSDEAALRQALDPRDLPTSWAAVDRAPFTRPVVEADARPSEGLALPPFGTPPAWAEATVAQEAEQWLAEHDAAGVHPGHEPHASTWQTTTPEATVVPPHIARAVRALREERGEALPPVRTWQHAGPRTAPPQAAAPDEHAFDDVRWGVASEAAVDDDGRPIMADDDWSNEATLPPDAAPLVDAELVDEEPTPEPSLVAAARQTSAAGRPEPSVSTTLADEASHPLDAFPSLRNVFGRRAQARVRSGPTLSSSVESTRQHRTSALDRLRADASAAEAVAAPVDRLLETPRGAAPTGPDALVELEAPLIVAELPMRFADLLDTGDERSPLGVVGLQRFG